MSNDLRIYGNQFDSKVFKDVEELNEKIEKCSNDEERTELLTKRLYRGMEINMGLNFRPWGSLYPY
jgi:hypothetical protein